MYVLSLRASHDRRHFHPTTTDSRPQDAATAPCRATEEAVEQATATLKISRKHDVKGACTHDSLHCVSCARSKRRDPKQPGNCTREQLLAFSTPVSESATQRGLLHFKRGLPPPVCLASSSVELSISPHDFIISSAMPRDFVVIPLALFQWEDSHGGGTAHRSRIGGMSGGVPNDELVTELKEVALEHVRISRNPDCESTSRFICGTGSTEKWHALDNQRISDQCLTPSIPCSNGLQRGRLTCLYADGLALADSMKILGLFGEWCV